MAKVSHVLEQRLYKHALTLDIYSRLSHDHAFLESHIRYIAKNDAKAAAAAKEAAKKAALQAKQERAERRALEKLNKKTIDPLLDIFLKILFFLTTL